MRFEPPFNWEIKTTVKHSRLKPQLTGTLPFFQLTISASRRSALGSNPKIINPRDEDLNTDSGSRARVYKPTSILQEWAGKRRVPLLPSTLPFPAPEPSSGRGGARRGGRYGSCPFSTTALRPLQPARPRRCPTLRPDKATPRCLFPP